MVFVFIGAHLGHGSQHLLLHLPNPAHISSSSEFVFLYPVFVNTKFLYLFLFVFPFLLEILNLNVYFDWQFLFSSQVCMYTIIQIVVFQYFLVSEFCI